MRKLIPQFIAEQSTKELYDSGNNKEKVSSLQRFHNLTQKSRMRNQAEILQFLLPLFRWAGQTPQLRYNVGLLVSLMCAGTEGEALDGCSQDGNEATSLHGVDLV